MGTLAIGGPDFVMGVELLSIMEAIVDSKNELNTVIPQMVNTAKEMGKVEIIYEFAKTINDNL